MTFTDKFRVKPGTAAGLDRRDPASAAGFSKDGAAEPLARDIARIDELQYLLYAEHRRALLVVLQGMDTSGKDGLIRHVMPGLDPSGCRVTSFKTPSSEELNHDFLWRIHRAVPGKGEVGVFNRSHYEDVLIVRVHDLAAKEVWKARYEQINMFERHLSENGVHIVKFFLHISRREQKERLLKRLADPTKNWKFSLQDVEERTHWDDYMAAYEDAIRECSTKDAPWYVIPADKKWFRNLAVARVIVETLERLDMKLPAPTVDPESVRIPD